ncbi:MAG: hypothetical protein KKG59_07560 [Nanoarchaeota archaeon]|nr:hypothetical protein [Nanoarchaeota archaeon]
MRENPEAIPKPKPAPVNNGPTKRIYSFEYAEVQGPKEPTNYDKLPVDNVKIPRIIDPSINQSPRVGYRHPNASYFTAPLGRLAEIVATSDKLIGVEAKMATPGYGTPFEGVVKQLFRSGSWMRTREFGVLVNYIADVPGMPQVQLVTLPFNLEPGRGYDTTDYRDHDLSLEILLKGGLRGNRLVAPVPLRIPLKPDDTRIPHEFLGNVGHLFVVENDGLKSTEHHVESYGTMLALEQGVRKAVQTYAPL